MLALSLKEVCLSNMTYILVLIGFLIRISEYYRLNCPVGGDTGQPPRLMLSTWDRAFPGSFLQGKML